MKFAINQTSYTLILMGGKIKLYPMGSSENADRFLVQDRWLNHPDIVKFEKLGKIKLVSPEELQNPTVPTAGKVVTTPETIPSSPPPSFVDTEESPPTTTTEKQETTQNDDAQIETQQGRRRRRKS